MTLARELADTAGRPQVDKNLLINGGMNVWQRSTSQTGISSTSTDGYVTVDRWSVYNSTGGTWTQSQSTDVPSAQGFGYSLKMDCTTANTSLSTGSQLVITQKIEAQNLQHLLFGTSSPKSITLSFWVKSNKTGTYVINPVRTDGGLRMISKAYTIDTANTWEKKTITFGGDETNAIANDNGNGIDFNFWLVACSNYTSGTLQPSWGSFINGNRAPGQVNLADSTSNEWYMTGCQLEIGESATDFQFEPYETILRKCQRYTYRPSTTVTDGAFGSGLTSATQGTFYIPYPVTMRNNPTVSFSAATNFKIIDGLTANTAVSSMAATSTHIHGAEIKAIASGTVAGRGSILRRDGATAFIEFDAEL